GRRPTPPAQATQTNGAAACSTRRLEERLDSGGDRSSSGETRKKAPSTAERGRPPPRAPHGVRLGSRGPAPKAPGPRPSASPRSVPGLRASVVTTGSRRRQPDRALRARVEAVFRVVVLAPPADGA